MSERIDLTSLGWGEFFEGPFARFRAEGLVPARVAREERDLYGVWCEAGRMSAEISGKMRHDARSRAELPGVGDWVAMAVSTGPSERRGVSGSPRGGGGPGVIHAVLPRRTRIARRHPGATTDEQILAANVDTAFLVSALDGSRNYHLPTIERFIVLAWESGAEPVVLLNKCDLCAEFEARVAEAEAIAPGVAVYAISALDGLGFENLARHFGPGKTAVFLGRSGVGKSHIINRLLGSAQLAIGDVRANDLEGRHTTTWREMILLPAGGVVIDTPGMREMQVWDAETGIAEGFDEIEEIALGCRFSDCLHLTEPGCAVKAAVEAGTLAPERLARFQNLRKEAAFLAAKQDEKLRLVEKQRSKKLSKIIKRFEKDNPKNR